LRGGGGGEVEVERKAGRPRRCHGREAESGRFDRFGHLAPPPPDHQRREALDRISYRR